MSIVYVLLPVSKYLWNGSKFGEHIPHSGVIIDPTLENPFRGYLYGSGSIYIDCLNTKDGFVISYDRDYEWEIVEVNTEDGFVLHKSYCNFRKGKVIFVGNTLGEAANKIMEFIPEDSFYIVNGISKKYGDNESIIVGDGCSIVCGDNCKVTCGILCNIYAGKDCVIDAGKGSSVFTRK